MFSAQVSIRTMRKMGPQERQLKEIGIPVTWLYHDRGITQRTLRQLDKGELPQVQADRVKATISQYIDDFKQARQRPGLAKDPTLQEILASVQRIEVQLAVIEAKLGLK